MFKLVVLSALISVAIARPGHLFGGSKILYSAPIVQEHSLEKVGEVVKTVPTAVSWQSSSIVHSKDHVEPIIAKVVKTYAAVPVVKTVHTPVVHTKFVAADPWTIAGAEHFGYKTAIPIDGPSAHLEYSAGW